MTDLFPTLESKRVLIQRIKNSNIDIVFEFNSCEECLTHIVRDLLKPKLKLKTN